MGGTGKENAPLGLLPPFRVAAQAAPLVQPTPQHSGGIGTSITQAICALVPSEARLGPTLNADR